MSCKSAFLLLFTQLLVSQDLKAGPQQDTDAGNDNLQEVAMIVEKALLYVRQPELLEVNRIKKDFPGEYNTSGCEDRFKFCSYVNTDESKRARLSSFEVPYRPSLVPAGGVMTVTLPDTGNCYHLSALNTLLGISGERPATPTGDMFFGADASETVILQYKKISQRYPLLSITAFVHGECVVTLNFDIKLNS